MSDKCCYICKYFKDRPDNYICYKQAIKALINNIHKVYCDEFEEKKNNKIERIDINNYTEFDNELNIKKIHLYAKDIYNKLNEIIDYINKE